GLLVPADRLADPVPAARALLERRRDLGDGVLERGVVGGTADGALYLVRAVGHAPEYAPEQAAGDTGRRSQHPHLRGLERRHVAVTALLAVKLELVAAIGREVVVVAGEWDGRHAVSGG